MADQEAEESASNVSYIPYADGEPSDASKQNSADSDSSYTSSESEDEATGKQVQMATLARTKHSAKRKSKTLRLGGRKLKALEIALMSIAIVIVLGLFSLPASYYIHESYHGNDQETANNISGVGPPQTSDACGNFSTVVDSSSVCSPESYTGGDGCRNYLLSWQSCILGDSSALTLTVGLSGSSQSDAEANAQLFFDLLAAFGQSTSPECEARATSFICLYLFPLCDEDGSLYLPSQELCLEVSTDVCQQEWATAQIFDQDGQLPDCADLPTSQSNNSASGGSITNSTADISNISCDQMFTLIDGICIADCKKFFTGPQERIEINVIVLLVSASFGLATAVILFILSFFRRKIMWRFPYVFLMYMTIEYAILAIFLIISLTDRGLFCSNISVAVSAENPTTYCTITGIATHYFLISMAYFWFFHVCSTFYKVMFPHLAKRTEGKQNLAHAGLVVLALVLPLPPVIVVLSDSDLEYFVLTYPPFSCISKSIDYVVPISMLLVLNVLLAIGTSLFVPMLWAIHKHHKALASSKRKARWRISIVERKLMLTLGYFVLFGTVSLVLLAVIIADDDRTVDIIQNFILCEAPGLNVNQNCTSNLTTLVKYSNLTTAAFSLMGMLPLIVLIFTINWKLTGKKIKTFLNKHNCLRPKQDPGVVAFSTYSPLPSATENHE